MFQNHLEKCVEECYQELLNTKDAKIKKTIKKVKDAVGENYYEDMLESLVKDMICNILEDEVPVELQRELIIEMLEVGIDTILSMKKMYTFKITLEGYEDKMYRIINVPAALTLADLGYAMLSIFNTEYSHLFAFEIRNQKYLCEAEREVSYSDFDEEEFAVDYDLSDFNFRKNSKFRCLYDYGEGYFFKIEVIDIRTTKEFITIEDLEVLEGKGFGIIEDAKHILDMYYHDKNAFKQFVKENNLDDEMFPTNQKFDLDTCNEVLYDQFMDVKLAYENPPEEFVN